MATGSNGFGLTHGYTSQDEQPDRDNSHEYRGGHGVSDGWIEKHVTRGVQASHGNRVRGFIDRQFKSTDRDAKGMRNRKRMLAVDIADSTYHAKNKSLGRKRKR